MGALCCSEDIIDYDNVEVELGHFYLLRVVGKGAFGKVRIVQHKRDKRNYALKYINKQKCIKMRAVENIIQERRLLEEINHPFVVNLRFAFQDDENLFMVIDLMLGGDLRFHLDRRQNGLEEDMVRFYCAEMALALAYLHSKRIVHRDLKPDNVLLDEAGHAHLTDFNIAVRYTETRPLTAVAGSMAYMAPEVLRKRGYFASVDWWSLGIVSYELLFGKRPFRGKTNQQLTQAILNDELRFPADAEQRVSPACLDALRMLIERDCEKRLGCTGFAAIRAHAWFHGYDWDKLEAKAVDPPFTPDTRNANFDATHELEELLLEDNPLKVRKRHKPKPGEKGPELSKEQQAMEDRFTVYDWYKIHAPKKSPGHKSSFTRMSAGNNKRNSYGSQGSSQGAGGGSQYSELRIREAKPDDPSTRSALIQAASEGCADLAPIDRTALADSSGDEEAAPLASAGRAPAPKARRRMTRMEIDGLDMDDDPATTSSPISIPAPAYMPLAAETAYSSGGSSRAVSQRHSNRPQLDRPSVAAEAVDLQADVLNAPRHGNPDMESAQQALPIAPPMSVSPVSEPTAEEVGFTVPKARKSTRSSGAGRMRRASQKKSQESAPERTTDLAATDRPLPSDVYEADENGEPPPEHRQRHD